jgi:outer membrane protein TolC
VAAAYIDYVHVNDRIKIAHLTEKILAGLLDTLDKRADVGDATLLELEQQRSALYSERSLVPSLELQRSNAIEAIAALLGTLPSALNLSDADLDSIHLPATLPELPSSLLLRRADVRSMESKLLAADVDIDVMRARLLPSFNLSAQAGYSGLIKQLIGPQSFFWNMFTNITTNVFDAGKLSSDVQLARLTHEEMIADYARTLLQAVRETETALNTIRTSEQRVTLQQEALQAANRAWNISNKMYGVGGADFMTLQDTERTYRRYTEDNQQLRSDFYHAYVNLFLALGGSEDSTTMNSDAARSAISWQEQPQHGTQDFWQVELDGIYQRQTVVDVLQDLQRRYPKQMAQKKLYPQLAGRVENLQYGSASWYRLRVAQFSALDEAEQFCALIRNDLQRCLILSGSSDKPVAEKK